MIIVEDTRNQINKHSKLNKDLTELGYQVVRSKLFVGDYSRLDNMSVCVDTKKDWVELAGNICGKQHTRFREECIRAKTAQIRLIILIEDKVLAENWKSPIKRNGQPICKVSGEVLAKAMRTMTEKYGVEFMNCDKSETARVILRILEGLWRQD